MNHIYLTSHRAGGITRTISRCDDSVYFVRQSTSGPHRTVYAIRGAELRDVETGIALARSGRFFGLARVALLRRSTGDVHVTAHHVPCPTLRLFTIANGRMVEPVTLFTSELDALSRAVSDAQIAKAA